MQYGHTFAKINKLAEFLDMLKEMNVHVPLLKTEMNSLKADVAYVNNHIEPLRDEVKIMQLNMKTTRDELGNIKQTLGKMTDNTDQVNEDCATQRRQLDYLADILNNLEPRLSNLVISVTETESKVLPSIEQQKQLVKDVVDTSDNVQLLQSSFNKVATSLADMERKMEEIKPSFDYVKDTVSKSKDLEKTISNFDIDIKGEVARVSSIQKKIEEAEIQSNDLSMKFTELQTRVDLSEKKQNQLQEKQSQLEGGIQSTDEKIVNQRSELESIQENTDNVKQALTTSAVGLEQTLNNVKNGIDEMVHKWSTLRSETVRLEERVEKEEIFSVYGKNTLPNLVGDVDTLKSSVLQNRLDLPEENQKKLQDKEFQLEARIQSNNEQIINQRSQLESIQDNIDKVEEELTTTTESLQQTLINVNNGVDEMVTKWSTVRRDTIELEQRIKEEENISKYVRKTLPNVVGEVEALKEAVTIPWFSILDILQLAAIIFITIHVLYPQYSVGNIIQSVNYKQKNDDFSPKSTAFQKPRSILDQIPRAPELDDKICIASFYSDTQKQHRSLVTSVLELSTRGTSIEILQHLVKGDDDIYTLPRVRYILVFVDYDERNFILENTGQDVGGKKVVTIQAAQKLEAEVFVTYVRDKGSRSLIPGHLYNTELSAFTSHPVLKGLENIQRCFSVYESYNNTQKEHIAQAIR